LRRHTRLLLEPLEDRLAPSTNGLPDILGPSTTPEGSLYTLDLDAAGRFVDFWTIDWGDGSAPETVSGSATQAQHTYADGPAAYTITVAATERTSLALTQWGAADGGNDHYYGLTSTASAWTAAESEALSHGGHLVSITSALEQDFIVRTFLAPPDDRRIFWIGINDAAVEGRFVWSDGEPVAYTNWQPPNEPNNFGGVEDYGTINWHRGQNRSTAILGSWNDTPVNGLNGALTGPQPYVGIMEFATLPLGDVTVRTLQVTVENVAPEAGLGGPDSGVRGQELTLTLQVSDPSQPDQDAGFTFAIDWNNDGTIDETVAGPSGTTVSHAFWQVGSHSVSVSATDRDGDVSLAATHTVTITAAALQGGVLVVGGTQGNDVIVLSKESPTAVRVWINGQDEGLFTPTNGLLAHGYAGDDTLTVSGFLGESQLYGDDGNDLLQGGPGDDALFGGTGNDILMGRSGNDILVGGDGDDIVKGGDGADVLLGGRGQDQPTRWAKLFDRSLFLDPGALLADDDVDWIFTRHRGCIFESVPGAKRK
jgi:Ca2+-binding RTX toxin-like protein